MAGSRLSLWRCNMAEGWRELDVGFPHITKDEPVKDQVEKMYNYLFRMKQGLQVTLETMDKSIRRLREENTKLQERIQELEK